ncbi:MAG: hypothetical protein LBJ00_10540 [Planctomycetaceae bacterium]|nr:hypothetical protein [Planctomycetaceae bacterium]
MKRLFRGEAYHGIPQLPESQCSVIISGYALIVKSVFRFCGVVLKLF